MDSGNLIGLLKTVHVLFVSIGIGGILIQGFLLRKFRAAGASEAAASERMALAITKFAESYGLLIAFLTGLLLGIITGEFGGRAYLHVKSLLALVLVGLSHVDLRNLKRMIALREAGKAQEADQVKQKHLHVATVSTVLIVVIVVLVVMKPF
ncbi:hypothetical protein HUU05_02280 [candidate division KSB1 bacterium]|nr:hypothetical protein [candidate division KSB1 bacterium]